MIQHKKNDLLIGFIASVLLSLFVNFSLLSLNYTILMQGAERFPVSGLEQHMLYVSLVWFFGVSFILFLFNRQGYKLGDRLFSRKKYKSVLLVLGLNVLLFFASFQLYPIFRHTVFTYAGIENEFMRFEEGHYDKMKRENAERESHSTDSPGDTVASLQNTAGKITDSHRQTYVRVKKNHPVQELYFSKKDEPGEKNAPGKFSLGHSLTFKPLATEHLFTVFVVFLGVLLLRLLNSEQQMRLEYECLKREKLQTSYNALMGQINPHFFFNSLNGLSSLIHAGNTDKTLKYLNQLSDVFRYILQSNKKELVTLAEELQFVESYTYLLSVRYEG